MRISTPFRASPSPSRNAIQRRARRTRTCTSVWLTLPAGRRNGWRIGDTRQSFCHSRERAGCRIQREACTILRANRVHDTCLDILFSLSASNGLAFDHLVVRLTPYWINIGMSALAILKGTASGFLWTSERDGFRHLYLYSEPWKPGTATDERGMGRSGRWRA